MLADEGRMNREPLPLVPDCRLPIADCRFTIADKTHFPSSLFTLHSQPITH